MATAAAAQVNISGFTNYVGFVFVNLERVACWETEQHFIFKQKHGLAAVWCKLCNFVCVLEFFFFFFLPHC